MQKKKSCPDLETPADKPSSEQSADAKWGYGWCIEHKLGMRYLVSAPDESKEYSSPIAVPKEAKPTDQLMCTFDDGTVAAIPGFTYNMYKEEEIKESIAMWSGQLSNNNLLQIRQRNSRKHLLSLFEQDRQIDQIVVENLSKEKLPYRLRDGGAEPRPVSIPNDHPAVVAAFAIMQPLAEALAKGEISIEHLKRERMRQAQQNRVRRKQKVEPDAAAAVGVEEPVKVSGKRKDKEEEEKEEATEPNAGAAKEMIPAPPMKKPAAATIALNSKVAKPMQIWTRVHPVKITMPAIPSSKLLI